MPPVPLSAICVAAAVGVAFGGDECLKGFVFVHHGKRFKNVLVEVFIRFTSNILFNRIHAV
jgi:hypothetical protein